MCLTLLPFIKIIRQRTLDSSNDLARLLFVNLYVNYSISDFSLIFMLFLSPFTIWLSGFVVFLLIRRNGWILFYSCFQFFATWEMSRENRRRHGVERTGSDFSGSRRRSSISRRDIEETPSTSRRDRSRSRSQQRGDRRNGRSRFTVSSDRSRSRYSILELQILFEICIFLM